MAMGIPVVASPAAVEGLEAKDGREVMIGSDARQIAGHVIALLRSDALRRRIGRDARELVCRRYDWKHAAKALDAAYATLDSAGGDRPR